MQATLSDLIIESFRIINQSQAPGRGISSEETAEGVRVANRMLDGWSAMAEKIFTSATIRHTLISGTASYTIGPSGDINTARPTEILQANIIMTDVTPEIKVPLAQITQAQFADFQLLNYSASIPTYLYYNKGGQGSALGTITLIGYPSSGRDLELFVPSLFDNAMSSSTTVTLPEGYLDAFVMTLAEKLLVYYPVNNKGTAAEIKDQARKARAALVRLNSWSPRQRSDAPSGVDSPNGKSAWTYLYTSGTFRR